MTVRKRAAVPGPARPAPPEPNPTPKPEDQPIAGAKWGVIVGCGVAIAVPYIYAILYHYKIEWELKKSILINAVVSLLGFVLTLALIPVASKYVLRRNLFGYDINKKGTPQGSVKV